ncbi:amidohydrolase [Nioella sediminis]|jgi:amidohydrolase|uniref:amidohydrolase n=1 Tax=Nioella sediminis TaxID=1912092 RepID=UPI0008FD5EAF|nr:amidohydrolase [Nioella sediminis]TBX19856.1 peptidase M20 [Roseovarius sp. JS7-11]
MKDLRLTNSDLADLTDWRRALHQRPEVSGEEAETARTVQAALTATGPDRIVTGLGGHGVAAFYDSGQPGPRVLLRCELDGLPIQELSDRPHRSQFDGKGHLCGHDGHMTMLAGIARLLGRQRPARGSVLLMFQPAEETGEGAARVVADPGFAAFRPDYAFAIHNFPGMPLGHVGVVDGPASCASRGMRVRLTGRTAHASQPETGVSPAPALARLMLDLPGLSRGADLTDPDFALVTVCHARLGEPAYGIAPGEAELYATLRSLTDPRMERLIRQAETMARDAAGDLALSIDYHDIFPACTNTPVAAEIVRRAGARAGLPTGPGLLPMRPSEDFGHFGMATGAESAFILLGAGMDGPDLHNPDYDFPDDLIGLGAALLGEILREILGD